MKDKQGLNLFDWKQWLCPGPTRVFSADELARGGQQAWPQGLETYLLISLLVTMGPLLFQVPSPMRWWFGLGFIAYMGASILTARWLWSNPSRKRLNGVQWALTLPFGAAVIVLAGLKKVLPKELVLAPLLMFGALVIVSSLGLWFLAIYRAQQIDARLRELDEQERNLKLARRLATAQIQPHFLFNTLASVQHWVDTQDARAGTTLRAFTAYLRATLPMFERETLSLNEELSIVRNYLEVMQARMGARLRWSAEVCEGVDGLPLPPGLLLTLVENAIGHGIEPALRGGSIAIRVSRPNEAQVLLEVSDDGVGLTQGSETAKNGLGLKNSDERLRQLYGGRARLTLLPQQPGCLARLEIDWMQGSK